MISKILICVLAFACFLVQPSAEEDFFEGRFNRDMTKEERIMLLELQKADVALRQAESQRNQKKSEYEQMIDLKKRGVVTGDELNSAREEYEEAEAQYKNAQISLEETLLNFLKDATHISVVRGEKYKSRDDRRIARIVIKNSSDVRLASMVEEAWKNYRKDISLPDVRALLNIENIFTSIIWNGVMVGRPYEIIVPSLPYGSDKTLEFELGEQDIEEVIVSMRYLNKKDERPIYLQKSSVEDIVGVTSRQFSQEESLGKSVLFDLELERLAETEKTFTLSVVNLPEKIRWNFEDRGKQLTKVKFSQGIPKINLNLRTYVPEEMPEEELDEPIRFYAVVADARAVEKLRELEIQRGSEPISKDELEAMRIGFELLELIPRGIGEIELSSPNLYYEINPGEVIEMRFTLENTGTVRLNNVRVKIDPQAPLWEARAAPEVIETIDPVRKVTVDIEVTPPANVDVGKYEVKVSAKTEHKGRPIESLEKNVTVVVKTKANILLATALVLLLVGLVFGVAIFTIRLSRR